MSEGINFSLKDSKVKITERTKGKMRIDIKLNAEFASAFRNFVSVFKPEEIDEKEFFRQLLFKGINTHIKDVQEFAKQQLENTEEETNDEQEKNSV